MNSMSPGKVVFGAVPGEGDRLIVSREKWFIFVILVLIGGGGRCPTAWFVFVVLYVVPARCLSFLLGIGRMAALLGEWGGGASQSFCSSSVLWEECFVVFYVVSFPPGVCVGI